MSHTPWAVVLGASVGTGAAISRAVAARPGLDVFGVHRGSHREAAAELVAEVEGLGRRLHFLEGDAASPEAAEAGAAEVIEVCGPRSVHLLVHSLASASLGDLAAPGEGRLSPAQIRKTYEVMAHSFLWWTRALLDADALAPGARVLALTNPLDASLIRACGLIASTKAALEGYVRALAMELGPLGFRVNLLRFPTVITPAVEVVYGPERIAAIERIHERMIPAGRMCTTDEVGRFVSLLCEPETEWFNGATIDFSGGMTLGLAELVLGGGGRGS